MGMVGELLTHLFLANSDRGFTSVNRFFNLEERSIKKGFDLVLRRDRDGELMFVEVKSSASGSKFNASKLLSLLKTSDADIGGKLAFVAGNKDAIGLLALESPREGVLVQREP